MVLAVRGRVGRPAAGVAIPAGSAARVTEAAPRTLPPVPADGAWAARPGPAAAVAPTRALTSPAAAGAALAAPPAAAAPPVRAPARPGTGWVWSGLDKA